jgi:hypothetical protein
MAHPSSYWIFWSGRIIIAIDACWLVFSVFVLGYLQKEYDHHLTDENYHIELGLAFLHFVTMVSMLYLTEVDKSRGKYALLNAEWINGVLLVIPLVTDIAGLLRILKVPASQREDIYFALMLGLLIFALIVTCVAVIWFAIVLIIHCLWTPEGGQENGLETPLLDGNNKKMNSQIWHKLKE